VGPTNPSTKATEDDIDPVICDGLGYDNDGPTSTMEKPLSARPQC